MDDTNGSPHSPVRYTSSQSDEAHNIISKERVVRFRHALEALADELVEDGGMLKIRVDVDLRTGLVQLHDEAWMMSEERPGMITVEIGQIDPDDMGKSSESIADFLRLAIQSSGERTKSREA